MIFVFLSTGFSAVLAHSDPTHAAVSEEGEPHVPNSVQPQQEGSPKMKATPQENLSKGSIEMIEMGDSSKADLRKADLRKAIIPSMLVGTGAATASTGLWTAIPAASGGRLAKNFAMGADSKTLAIGAVTAGTVLGTYALVQHNSKSRRRFRQ